MSALRNTLLVLALTALAYVIVVPVANAHNGPVRHRWSGIGTSGPIHFLMPAGPLPGVLSNPWTLRYSLRCHGVKTVPGAPDGTTMNAVMSIDLEGKHLIGGSSLAGSVNRVTDTMADHFTDGGNYTLEIQALPTCAWTVVASSGGRPGPGDPPAE